MDLNKKEKLKRLLNFIFAIGSLWAKRQKEKLKVVLSLKKKIIQGGKNIDNLIELASFDWASKQGKNYIIGILENSPLVKKFKKIL